jgi:UDP-glucose 4-epimerase
MGRLLGVRADPEFFPPRPGDVRHSHASIERARLDLGFSPRVGFEEGLKRTVEGYRRGGLGVVRA